MIGALNCLCCSLIIGGGFLAAFLYSKECKSGNFAFKPGSGALVGLVAGLFYSVASTIVQGLVSVAGGGPSPEDLEKMVEMLEQMNVPPESVDQAIRFMEGMSGPSGLLFGFLITLLMAAIFSTVGGLIGGAVFKNEPAAPAPPAPDMPAPPAP